MQQYDMIVLGAGISGLSMAHHCQHAGLNTLVLEKSARVGGTFHSEPLEYSDFWLELGTHTAYNSYGNILNMLQHCQMLDQLRPREKVSFKLWQQGKIRAIPFQLNYLELLFHVPRLLWRSPKNSTICEYYSSIAGTKNYQNLLSHAFSAVLCQNVDTIPAEMLFRKKPRRKDIMRSFTLPNGLQSITDAIAQTLQIQTQQQVERIIFEPEQVIVITADNEYRSRFLTLATPVTETTRLLETSFPALSQLLATMGQATVETMGVVVRQKNCSLPVMKGLIGVNDVFFSMVSRDIVKHPDYRGFTFHFKSQLLDEAQKITKICEILHVQPQQLEYRVEKQNILPTPTQQHLQLLTQITQLLPTKPLALTGNYFLGVSAEDCAIRSRAEFERVRALL
jgi:protoporphyrinogen/coproporphyrinogen III oxidase